MEALKQVYQCASLLNSSSKQLCLEHKSFKHSTPFSKHSPFVYHQGRRNSASCLTVRATNSSHIAIKERNGSVKEHSLNKGLGIVDFLKGKHFLVTGATGFLAKVVIEKILRAQPQVGKLFLVIKANDSEAALHRLKKEIICSELFRCLRDIYGDHYEEFVWSKLVPVAGDVSLDNLGIQADVAEKLADYVDIILNCAANTSFDARYDVALETNTKGPSRLMEFGRSCRKLQLFLHVSTAYANGQREGRIVEKPFKMGESPIKELEDVPPLNILHEFELARKTLNSLNSLNEHDISRAMKDMAFKRARIYGWQDVYVFSKAMGEMFLDYNRGEIPLAIVRPSVIEGTYTDPFPGWIEGFRMVDPIIAYYGKGQLSALMGDPNLALDIVPADMVANAILATMAKHVGKAGMKVYQMASSVANPIVLRDLFGMFHQYFKAHPYVDARGRLIKVNDTLKLFGNMEDFSSHGVGMPLNEFGLPSLQMEKQELIALKVRQRVNKYISGIYQSYFTYKGRFDNSNIDLLFQELSQEEKKIFGFNVNGIEWNNYIMDIHIPGLLRNVIMKERSKSVPMEQERIPTVPILTRPYV
ncbi:hypothetical protein KI387_025702 [Taxus chinensis]|uniref:Fatty acyl-CoA reductase n=1 Tax=Taxus chinensis TaxID=29808 RepID=A0AA38FTP4_TAXCH|nr:hypothetical protein KI387_025702 [Taxus chinensis]